jgi:hypothetical protein
LEGLDCPLIEDALAANAGRRGIGSTPMPGAQKKQCCSAIGRVVAYEPRPQLNRIEIGDAAIRPVS